MTKNVSRRENLQPVGETGWASNVLTRFTAQLVQKKIVHAQVEVEKPILGLFSSKALLRNLISTTKPPIQTLNW
jgi:hypothetical protein